MEHNKQPDDKPKSDTTSTAKPRKIDLDEWEEVFGPLQSVERVGTDIKITLEGASTSVYVVIPSPSELPPDLRLLLDAWKEFVGTEVGVLRTDSQSKPYRIRVKDTSVALGVAVKCGLLRRGALEWPKKV